MSRAKSHSPRDVSPPSGRQIIRSSPRSVICKSTKRLWLSSGVKSAGRVKGSSTDTKSLSPSKGHLPTGRSASALTDEKRSSSHGRRRKDTA